MHVLPYLFFNGRCEEALDFYQRAIGAEVTAKMRYGESPEPAMAPPGSEQNIMHAEFNVGPTKIMASDGMCDGKPAFQGISLSIAADDPAHAERLFAALGDGGQVQMPLMETFFSPKFGMVADRFGVSWMIMAYPPGQPA